LQPAEALNEQPVYKLEPILSLIPVGTFRGKAPNDFFQRPFTVGHFDLCTHGTPFAPF
jgi:hypothetical protein